MTHASFDRRTQYAESVRQTLQSLDGTVADTSLASISGLGIPQVRALKREIAEIFPASNLPAFLLQGLIQLKDRSLDEERISGDLRVLFRETRRLSLYGTFFAAPALIIFGYQRLLTLAGKDVDSAFPEGTWQFYTEFGLREDAARHAVETLGFAEAATGLSVEQAASCWVAAAAFTIANYDALLELEWRERAVQRCIELALTDAAAAQLGKLPRKASERRQLVTEATAALRTQYNLDRLAVEWAAQRPYHGPADNPLHGYIPARRAAFNTLIQRRLAGLPEVMRNDARARYEEWATHALPAFQQQMSLAATLQTDSFREQRTPLAPEALSVAIALGGTYYLIDVYERDADGNLLITPRDDDPRRPGRSLPLSRNASGEWQDRYGQPVQIARNGTVRIAGVAVGTLRPAAIRTIRSRVAAALRETRPLRPNAPRPLGIDSLLATAPRARQDELRSLLPAADRKMLTALQQAPIVICWDDHEQRLPLHQLRRSSRGVGDHALSILRAGTGMVFDMSHIFFDGVWGAMLAEIMTGFAIAHIPVVAGRAPSATLPPAVQFRGAPSFLSSAADAAANALIGVAAESRTVQLAPINSLRRKLATREIEVTVNDLLMIARYEHAATYQPGPVVLAALDELPDTALREQILTLIANQRTIMPVLLILMDAGSIDPRERIQPAAVRNFSPDLLPLLARCEQLLKSGGKLDNPAQQPAFIAVRSELCMELVRFGVMSRGLREITTRGEGFTTTALKLMAHLPQQMQSLLDVIPQKIDVLNEIVKGTEVFSNIGQVAAGSSLNRFISSRDDGDTKDLIWGLMTTNQGQMVVSLRDFRPYVQSLLNQGHTSLAELLAADYLETYAECVNQLIRRLTRVLSAK